MKGILTRDGLLTDKYSKIKLGDDKNECLSNALNREASNEVIK